ncbi:MAG: hypothetical protein ACFCVF_04415 [Kineosporiaceae bacterium]
MDPVLVTYAVYLTLAVGLTVWVSRVLSRNGQRFLRDVFPGDGELAHAVNQLLLVGFYLISLGYVALTMRVGGDVDDARAVLEEVVRKLGIVLVGLGVLHLTNLLVLSTVRRRRLRTQQPPPFPIPGPPSPWPPVPVPQAAAPVPPPQ